MKVLPSCGRKVIGFPDDTTMSPVLVGDSYPSIAASRLWLNRLSGVCSDLAGTIPTAIDGTIASWRAVGGDWGTDLLTQPIAGQQPTLKSDGIQADGSDDRLDLAARITLTGEYTVWMVGTRSAATDYLLSFGGVHPGGDFGDTPGALWADGNALVILGAGFVSTPCIDTSLRIYRFRRDGSGNAYFKGSGSEVNLGSFAGDIRVDAVLSRTGAFPITNSSGSRIRQLVLRTANTTPGDADDLAVIAKLQSLESGVAGP